MLERLRNQIGTAGLIVAIVALIAALGGGAYAATSNSGKATASAKQGKQGKPGKPGKTGPAGPAGPQGSAGAAGAKGDAGSKGDTGAQGPVGPQGPIGPKGTTGFTSTLPSEKAETGMWSIGLVSEAGQVGTSFPGSMAPISFSIPLEAQLGETKVHVINQAGEEEDIEGTRPSTACHGSVASPTADPGHLCVYIAEVIGGASGSELHITRPSDLEPGAEKVGAMLFLLHPKSASNVGGYGTWAVTAP